LQGILVKFSYEGQRVKVKVTAEKKSEIHYSHTCISSLGNNSGCNMGFLDMTDRICNRHLRKVVGNTRIRGWSSCLRLEGNLNCVGHQRIAVL